MLAVRFDYFMLSSQRGGDQNGQRVEFRNEDPAGGGAFTIDGNADTTPPQDVHFAVVLGIHRLANDKRSRFLHAIATSQERPWRRRLGVLARNWKCGRLRPLSPAEDPPANRFRGAPAFVRRVGCNSSNPLQSRVRCPLAETLSCALC